MHANVYILKNSTEKPTVIFHCIYGKYTINHTNQFSVFTYISKIASKQKLYYFSDESYWLNFHGKVNGIERVCD